MLSVAVVLAYAAVDRGKPIAASGRLWFYLAYGLALWAEPAQLAYAAPAVLFALVVDEIRRGPIVVREAIARLIRDGIGVLIITVALVLFFAARGELAGVVDNTYDLLAGGIYGALPTTLDVAFRTHPGAIVSITAPFALLFVGAYLSAKRGSAAAVRLGAAIAGCGIIGIMVDQKYFIRGPLGGQIFDTTAVGALLLLAVLIRSSRLGRIATWVTVGAMTAIVVNNANLWRPGYERVSAAVGRTNRTIRTLGEPALMKQANEHAFDKERFADFHDEMKIVEWMQARAMKGLYVMGDVPILYLFQPSPPPYQVNIYNTSPMRAQLQVRSWIRERQPQMVVLDPRAVSFDGVPHIVRVPILTAEVILNYVPETTIGPYRILTRREGKPIPFEFWQGIYGASIDFGYLLQQSSNPRWPDCAGNKPQDEQCLRYLWLRFAQAVGTDTRVVLPVQVGSAKFEISFVRTPGTSEYLIPLDRIWFWLAAETAGIGAQIQIPDGLVAEHRYVGKKPPTSALY
jgi:hypothetical protein